MIYFYLSNFFINLIKNQINKILFKDFLQLSNDINSIFNNVNNDITKLIFSTLKIKNRNNKLSFVDVLDYIFNYSSLFFYKKKFYYVMHNKVKLCLTIKVLNFIQHFIFVKNETFC